MLFVKFIIALFVVVASAVSAADKPKVKACAGKKCAPLAAVWDAVTAEGKNHSPSLRTAETLTPVRGYVEMYDFSDSGCPNANFRSSAIVKIGRCIQDGKASKRLTVNQDSNGANFMTMQEFSDKSCKKPKKSETIEMPPLNVCSNGAAFDLSPNFPATVPAFVAGSAGWAFNSKQSDCKGKTAGDPYEAVYYNQNVCINGDGTDVDLKVVSCSDGEIRYHTYASKDGSCSGKLKVKKWSNKHECKRNDAWGIQTNGYIRHFCQ